MKLIGKILSLPLILVTGILYGFCKFVVIASGAVLGILSGIVFLAALGIWIWRVGKLGGLNDALRDFLFS